MTDTQPQTRRPLGYGPTVEGLTCRLPHARRKVLGRALQERLGMAHLDSAILLVRQYCQQRPELAEAGAEHGGWINEAPVAAVVDWIEYCFMQEAS